MFDREKVGNEGGGGTLATSLPSHFHLILVFRAFLIEMGSSENLPAHQLIPSLSL